MEIEYTHAPGRPTGAREKEQSRRYDERIRHQQRKITLRASLALSCIGIELFFFFLLVLNRQIPRIESHTDSNVSSQLPVRLAAAATSSVSSQQGHSVTCKHKVANCASEEDCKQNTSAARKKKHEQGSFRVAERAHPLKYMLRAQMDQQVHSSSASISAYPRSMVTVWGMVSSIAA